MPSFNQVQIAGNLTRDVELRITSAGTSVADIGIAINERVKKGDEWVDEPVFVDVTLWGRMAEVANEYLRKGSPVLIGGRLRYESWNDDSGSKRSKLKVVGDKLQLLGNGTGESKPATSQPRTAYDSMVESDNRNAASQPLRDDEAPF